MNLTPYQIILINHTLIACYILMPGTIVLALAMLTGWATDSLCDDEKLMIKIGLVFLALFVLAAIGVILLPTPEEISKYAVGGENK